MNRRERVGERERADLVPAFGLQVLISKMGIVQGDGLGCDVILDVEREKIEVEELPSERWRPQRTTARVGGRGGWAPRDPG